VIARASVNYRNVLLGCFCAELQSKCISARKKLSTLTFAVVLPVQLCSHFPQLSRTTGGLLGHDLGNLPKPWCNVKVTNMRCLANKYPVPN